MGARGAVDDCWRGLGSLDWEFIAGLPFPSADWALLSRMWCDESSGLDG